ncbi:MAG: HEAT repeat domain-containing protein [Ardenticatenaceae bacterium]|nr:HEAT repeat domain-containing protein [Ardenticatenaceae bacterium]
MKETENINYDELFEMLFDENRDVTVSKIYQLSDLPTREFEQFFSRWQSLEPDRKGIIARHMADISEENFVVDFAPFAGRLMTDPAAEVRLASLDMLWDCSDVALIDPIIERMEQDQDDRVRASAAATLGHYMLMIQWGEIDDQYESSIATALLAQFNGAMTPVEIRRAALESISSASLDVVPDLINQAYTSRDPLMQLSAVFAMGRTADSRWSREIRTELDSDDPDMRAEAGRAAGALGSSDFADQLAQIAKFDDHIEAQIAAIYALGQIGNELASKTLDEIVSDEEYEDLHEIAEEAMEEMMVMGMDFDLSLLDWQDDDNLREF